MRPARPQREIRKDRRKQESRQAEHQKIVGERCDLFESGINLDQAQHGQAQSDHGRPVGKNVSGDFRVQLGFFGGLIHQGLIVLQASAPSCHEL